MVVFWLLRRNRFESAGSNFACQSNPSSSCVSGLPSCRGMHEVLPPSRNEDEESSDDQRSCRNWLRIDLCIDLPQALWPVGSDHRLEQALSGLRRRPPLASGSGSEDLLCAGEVLLPSYDELGCASETRTANVMGIVPWESPRHRLFVSNETPLYGTISLLVQAEPCLVKAVDL